jgi:hypothetical protein
VQLRRAVGAQSWVPGLNEISDLPYRQRIHQRRHDDRTSYPDSRTPQHRVNRATDQCAGCGTGHQADQCESGKVSER